jgi:hypothetical protein
MKFTFHQILIIIEHLHITWDKGHSRSFLRGQGHSVHAPYLRKTFLFQQFKQVFDHIIMLVLCKCLADICHSRWFSNGRGHLKYATFTRKKFQIDYTNKIKERCLSDRAHSRSLCKSQAHSKYSLYSKQTFNDHCACHS